MHYNIITLLHYRIIILSYYRIITFSKLDSHSSPLFKSLGLIKLFGTVLFQSAIFMYKFHNNVLPAAFHSFFTKVTSVHNCNTRFAAKKLLLSSSC